MSCMCVRLKGGGERLKSRFGLPVVMSTADERMGLDYCLSEMPRMRCYYLSKMPAIYSPLRNEVRRVV